MSIESMLCQRFESLQKIRTERRDLLEANTCRCSWHLYFWLSGSVPDAFSGCNQTQRFVGKSYFVDDGWREHQSGRCMIARNSFRFYSASTNSILNGNLMHVSSLEIYQIASNICIFVVLNSGQNRF